MKVSVLGNRDSVLFFLSLGLNVVFTEDEEDCKKKLDSLLKNDFKLIYITDNFFEFLSSEVDDIQKKYNATITFIPSGKKNLNCGAKILEIYAKKATGSTACLKQ